MTGAVYVDFDDVLCETARTLADIVAEAFGKRTRFEDIYSFELEDAFGLNPDEHAMLIRLFHDDGVLAAIPPVPGAVEGMRAWAAAGVNVHVVTGRPPATRAASLAWLDAQGIPHAGITFVDKYGRGHPVIPGVPQMTLEELAQCAFALIVDDSPDMACFFAEQTQVPVALFDRPWNARLTRSSLSRDIARCRNWTELISRFPYPGKTGREPENGHGKGSR